MAVVVGVGVSLGGFSWGIRWGDKNENSSWRVLEFFMAAFDDQRQVRVRSYSCDCKSSLLNSSSLTVLLVLNFHSTPSHSLCPFAISPHEEASIIIFRMLRNKWE